MKILGTEIEVLLAHLDDNHGDYDTDKKQIRIDLAQKEEDKLTSLWHEMVHALLDITGHAYGLADAHEEALVRAMENMMPFVDKKKLRAILKKAKKK